MGQADRCRHLPLDARQHVPHRQRRGGDEPAERVPHLYLARGRLVHRALIFETSLQRYRRGFR